MRKLNNFFDSGGWLSQFCGGESSRDSSSSAKRRRSTVSPSNWRVSIASSSIIQRNWEKQSDSSSVETACSSTPSGENLTKNVELTKRGIRRFLEVAQRSGISDLWFWGRTRLKTVSSATAGTLWLKRGVWEIHVEMSYPVSMTLVYSVSRLTALLMGEGIVDRWGDECAENGFRVEDVIGLDFSTTGEWLVIGAREVSVRDRLLRILAVLRYMKDLRSKLKRVVLSQNVRHRLAYGSRTVVPAGSLEACSPVNARGLCIRASVPKEQTSYEEEIDVQDNGLGSPGRTPKRCDIQSVTQSLESGELLPVKRVGRR